MKLSIVKDYRSAWGIATGASEATAACIVYRCERLAKATVCGATVNLCPTHNHKHPAHRDMTRFSYLWFSVRKFWSLFVFCGNWNLELFAIAAWHFDSRHSFYDWHSLWHANVRKFTKKSDKEKSKMLGLFLSGKMVVGVSLPKHDKIRGLCFWGIGWAVAEQRFPLSVFLAQLLPYFRQPLRSLGSLFTFSRRYHRGRPK